MTVTSATSADGRRLRFVHNWSWEPARLDLPGAVRDVLGGTENEAGEKLEGAWDVRLLLENQQRFGCFPQWCAYRVSVTTTGSRASMLE